MAITDYIPNIFGSTPEVYRGLLDAPERASLENRANIGGLLGFAGALAQGMSPQGYRRSALQNVLTALGAGYGAAGQTYDAGLNQVSNVMKLAQAKRQLTGLAAMKQANPDIAYLADVSPDEFVRLVSARERAKRYGLLTNPNAAPSAAPTTVVPSVAPVEPVATVEPAPAPAPEAAAPVGLMSAGSGGFPVSGNYGSLGVLEQTAPRVFDETKPFALSSGLITQAAPAAPAPAPVSAAPVTAPSAATPSATKNILVSPEDQAKSDRLYAAAVEAELYGDKAIGDEYRRQAKILNPDETITFRDGYLVSSRRGVLMKVFETKTLTPAEAIAERLPTDRGQVYQRDPSGKISRIEGTESTELDKAELLKILPGQFTNIYPTLRNRADNLISRASKLTRDQINEETKAILDADSKILADLDPKLQAAEMARRKASKTDLTVYTGDLSKTTAGEVEKGVLSDADAISRLNNITASYKPEYQKIPYRGAQAWSAAKDRVLKLSEPEKRQLTDYSKYRQNSLQNLNKTIKDLTGAAMGVQEADRIMASLPNAGTGIFDGDSPTEFEAKLDNAVQQTKYALARKNYALKQGIKEKAWEKIDLSDMPSIVNKRAEEIAEAYKLDPTKQTDKATIKRQLAAEFGIPF